MVDLVSMPIKIVPYLKDAVKESSGEKEAEFTVYQLGRKWGKETVKISGEKCGMDELPTKAALVSVHSGLTNVDISVTDGNISAEPYESKIDDDFFLAGYMAGIVSELLEEKYVSRIKDGSFDIVKVERNVESELSKSGEERTEKVDLKDLEEGESYLVLEEEKDAPISYDLFLTAVDQGMPSICFTRVFPPKIRDKFENSEFPIFWLSTVEDMDDINTIDPKSYREMLFKIISSFLKSKQGIFIIHGLEFLISHNDFKSVFNFIQDIKDLTALHQGIFLLPLYPTALDQKQLDNLKSELKEFRI